MGIRIDTSALRSEISYLISRALKNIDTGRTISEVLTSETKTHIENKYPGSKHWSPEKVKIGVSTTDTGSTDVEIAGATRAYHNITIRPINGSWLTIPIGTASNGMSAPEIDGLFKPKGKNILAKVMDGELVAVFALVREAFQPQDSSLLPTDEHFAEAIGDRWVKLLFSKL